MKDLPLIYLLGIVFVKHVYCAENDSTAVEIKVTNYTIDCSKLQPILAKQGDACRCYDLEDVSDIDKDRLIANNQSDRRPLLWVGCTRERMPMIYRALNSVPNETILSKLWIWDSLIPLVPSRFFVKIRTEKLILENNHLGELAPGVLTPTAKTLKVLILRNNIIKEANWKMFADLNELRKLDLSGNLLTELNENSLGSLNNLRILSFYNNKLRSLGHDTFRNVKNVKYLNLASNFITSISSNAFRGLENLETLSLENNKISQIAVGAFDHLPNLKSLNLGGNFLTSLTLPNSLSNLKQIYLNNNSFQSLKDLKVDLLRSLELMHLDKNKIVSLENDNFKRFLSLRVLSITSNKIATLQIGTLNGLKNLTVLSLQNNQIDKIPKNFFASTTQLKQLFVSQNFLTEINDETFSNLSKLTVLSLAHNQIKSIERNAFAQLSSLERLFLNDNFLELLDENLTLPNVKSLHAVDVSDNLWQCECPLLWFSKWIVDHAEIVINNENTICQKSLQPVGDVSKDLEENCRWNFRMKNQTLSDSDKVTNVVWITTLGFILGIVSLLILLTIVALYLQDGGRWTFAKFDQQQQRHLLKRVPSDMVNLIPKEMIIQEKA